MANPHIRGWRVLKLLRPCPRCEAPNVRVFENATTGEHRCTRCMDIEHLGHPLPLTPR